MASDVLYEAMKLAAKNRKIKASPRHDLYKRVDPYFFNVFYAAQNEDELKTENVNICSDIGLKYCRFDELRIGIIEPDKDCRFTDKIRANFQYFILFLLLKLYGTVSDALPEISSSDRLVYLI